jgi:hypothetical protein
MKTTIKDNTNGRKKYSGHLSLQMNLNYPTGTIIILIEIIEARTLKN